jgi:multidrug efflux pump subunit AcrB
MKFVFPILAILVCGAAAYFSLTQSDKFQEYQDKRLLAISTNKTVTASADKADTEIEKEQALLEESKKNLEIVTASVQALESDATRLKNELVKVDADLAAQNEEKKQLDNALDEVKKIFADMNLGDDVNEDNLADKIAEIDEDIKAKRANMEELDALVEGAKKSLAGKQEAVARLVVRKDARDTRISRNAMEARVTAVDSDWGFLVIGAGANSGFTPQTTLLVKRDGRLIGKVNPSAIEPTQTIAEIDFKTISPGVRIQPGDSVILAKPASN